MPKELPGFYYDPEKNRYFPYKGPIPGSSKPKPHPILPSAHTKQMEKSYGCIRLRQVKLLQARELCGNIISSSKGKLSFQAEYQNRHASRPLVWKYKGTKMMANMALEHVVADVTMPHGLMGRDILLSSGVNGLFCLLEIGAEQEVGRRQFYYEADCVGSHNLDHIARHKQLIGQLGSSHTAMTHMPSDVTCIKASKKYSLPSDETMSRHFVMTTLGSDSDPGSVYLVDLSKPIDFDAGIPIPFHELAAFKQTLWTADCDPHGGGLAVIGTNRGAALLNIETGVSSWVLRCKSDVFSVQLNQSGKLVLCGLRNGGIVTVDTRQKQVKRSTYCSPAISMPSSVCCLASLNLCDQYFLASSMDGSIKLYDYRMIHRHRRAVQSYEGNVNSHTRLQLGVDPSDKFVVSGGEDCNLRMWNIKSGELLFKDRFMNSTPSAVCWPRNKGVVASREDSQVNRFRYNWEEDHNWGAWVGSAEGIYYMDWL